MTKAELFAKVDSTWLSAKRKQELKASVEEYSSALIAAKPLVSGSLPVDSAIKEIENLMERWHLARDNDDETLQGINDVLVNIGLLGWFNRQ